MNYGKSATKRRMKNHPATMQKVGNKIYLLLCT